MQLIGSLYRFIPSLVNFFCIAIRRSLRLSVFRRSHRSFTSVLSIHKEKIELQTKVHGDQENHHMEYKHHEQIFFWNKIPDCCFHFSSTIFAIYNEISLEETWILMHRDQNRVPWTLPIIISSLEKS